MRFLLSTAGKDLRRNLRNPYEFLIWLGIPFFIGAVIILATGGKEGPRPQIHLLVADEDDSFLSGLLLGALSQEAMGGLIRAEEVTRRQGGDRMDRGEATALLVIPDGFGTAFLKEEPTTLTLVTNPALAITPRIVEEMLSIVADGHFYLHRLIGDQLRRMAAGPPEGRHTFPDLLVSAFSVRFNQLMESVLDYFDPPVIELATGSIEAPDAPEAARSINFGELFAPGVLFMSLLFLAMALAGDLWVERREHTLRRVAVTPRSVVAFLGGKMLAGLCTILGVTLFALIVAYLHFGWNLLTFPLAVAWSVCSGAMLLAAMTLLQLAAPSQRGASILSVALIFPLMMMGGSFFPFEAMPAWMARVGKWTPNGWALENLKNILLKDVDLGSVSVGFAGLVALTVIFFLLSAHRLRRGFAQG